MSEPITDARLAEIRGRWVHGICTGHSPTDHMDLFCECFEDDIEVLILDNERIRAGIRTIMARDDVGMYAAAELALLLGEGQGS